MMPKISFVKMVAVGNDFVVVRGLSGQAAILKKLAQKICDRKYGVGADGLLVMEKSQVADARMRIFNPDGSEAEMCGNGVRCFGYYVKHFSGRKKDNLKIQTKAGIIKTQIRGNNVKAQLTDPKEIKLDISIRIHQRALRINFINTGVPHAVIFVQGLDQIDVSQLGRQIRFHPRFAPRGTNVNFVEVLSRSKIKIRTYERGVEDETLACGTGATAAALIAALKLNLKDSARIDVFTKSSGVLKIYFQKTKTGFKDVWLEGRVSSLYKGEYHV